MKYLIESIMAFICVIAIIALCALMAISEVGQRRKTHSGTL